MFTFFRHFPKNDYKKILFPFFWFLVGFILTGVLLSSFVFFYFQKIYESKIYPGIYIDSLYVGEKSPDEVKALFDARNKIIAQNTIIITYASEEAQLSAQSFDIGYNSKLMADQAYSIGRSQNLFTNIYLILDSYINGTSIYSSYTYSTDKLKTSLAKFQNEIYQEPVEALFTVKERRVTAFQESTNGRAIDYDKLSTQLKNYSKEFIRSKVAKTVRIALPIKILTPTVTTDKANNLGIVELIGTGTSFFRDSIANREYNVSLATSRINGALIAPGEEFSFDQTLGDVSKFTGYKEAYIISNGRTVLGDGGGVCQVSTTLFRAILNAGLPITERYAHAYRPHYYEIDSAPGFDATIYSPSVDLKFKNDTKSYILIQTNIDMSTDRLTFYLWGKKDGREVTISKPIITNQTPPPEASYQDDPTLPKGVIKQVDFAAWGARVQFDRIVKKDGKILYNDRFVSNYQPWRAVYLRGTL